MINRNLALPIAFALLVGAQPALAEDAEDDWLPGTFAGGVGLFSDYSFRGISQTDRGPAIQGNIEYSFDTGFYGISPYIGFWASNIDFDGVDDANIEIDTLFGIRGLIGETGLSWDLGGIYYAYPGVFRAGGGSKADGDPIANYDYWEVAAKLGYAITDYAKVGLSYYYSPEFFGNSGDGNYLNFGGSVTIPGITFVDLTLNAGVGHQWIEKQAVYGAESYLDWTVGATIGIKGVNFSIAYVDTDLSKSDCFGGTNLCEPRAVVGVSTAF